MRALGATGWISSPYLLSNCAFRQMLVLLSATSLRQTSRFRCSGPQRMGKAARS